MVVLARRHAENLHRKPRLSLKPAKAESVMSGVVFLFVSLVIFVGWLIRRDGLIEPDSGLGYALGIVGGSMMILLLGYPLRKRIKPRSKGLGSVGFWFRFHMLLGLMGPTAILYHSRFNLGSLNSSVALIAMLVVASSGLLGRFLYSRVHRGYSGRKVELRELRQDMDATLLEFGSHSALSDEQRRGLEDIEARALSSGTAFWSSASAVIVLGVRTRVEERKLRSGLSLSSDQALRLRAALHDFFDAARRAAEFAFYERLLRLWHLLHFPLFVLMVAAVILHIVAVHMY